MNLEDENDTVKHKILKQEEFWLCGQACTDPTLQLWLCCRAKSPVGRGDTQWVT
jgi:hypothetical protein